MLYRQLCQQLCDRSTPQILKWIEIYDICWGKLNRHNTVARRRTVQAVRKVYKQKGKMAKIWRHQLIQGTTGRAPYTHNTIYSAVVDKVWTAHEKGSTEYGIGGYQAGGKTRWWRLIWGRWSTPCHMYNMTEGEGTVWTRATRRDHLIFTSSGGWKLGGEVEIKQNEQRHGKSLPQKQRKSLVLSHGDWRQDLVSAIMGDVHSMVHLVLFEQLDSVLD